MKKIFLICLFNLFASAIFAQLLVEPKLKNTFTVSSGNLLVIDTWNEIRKSDISYDDVKKMQKDIASLTKELDKTQKELKEAEREIANLKREMDKKHNDLVRQIEELKRRR